MSISEGRRENLFLDTSGAGLIPLCVAQTTNQGPILDTVRDPSGAVIEGVHVAVTRVDRHIARNAVSNHEGFYRLDFLQPGARTV